MLIAIDRWLERDVIHGAREITPADIKEARKRWKYHRANRPSLPRKGSLLDALTTNPLSFADGDFVVWVYADHTVPQWLETTVAEEKETRKLGFDIYPYYDVTAPTPPPGSYILDFNSENTERVILDGLYQVLRDSPLIKRRGSNVLLCREARFDDLPLGNRKRWEQAATKAANGDFKSWKASDFASDFLVSSA